MAVNVVVPLDGSRLAERSLGCGKLLAATLGGVLVAMRSALDDDDYDDYDDVASYLDGLELPGGSRREVRVRLSAAKAIDTVARQWSPSLVCMSARGRSARAEAVFGSVTAEVLAQGAAPVLIVGPTFRWATTSHCQSVLVCLDDTVESLAAIEPASQLAQELDVSIGVVTVVEQSTAPDDVRDAIEVRLRAIDAPTCHVDVVVGDDVASALVQRAEATPGTLLAMATHGRTRAQKLVAGSVLSTVVRHGDSPVLAVPPHRAAKSWLDWTPS